MAANVPTADQLSVKAEAIYDYQGRSAAELTFKKGQVITNVRILEGPWWKGNIGEVRGAFPASYVKVMDDKRAKADAAADLLPKLAGPPGQAAAEQLPKALATFDWPARKDTEISFNKGDIISEVRKMAGEWWRGTINGKRGYFPKQYATIIGEGVAKQAVADVFHSEKPPLARAIYDFVGQADNELTFKEGDVLGQVQEQPGGQWLMGTRGGHKGLFPKDYVLLLDAKRPKCPFNAKVVHKFVPRDVSQLPLMPGDEIIVLELCDKVTGGWWVGKKGDKVGYIPANYAIHFAKAVPCEKCQKRKAKAKVTLTDGQRVRWCRTCVSEMGVALPPKNTTTSNKVAPVQTQPASPDNDVPPPPSASPPPEAIQQHQRRLSQRVPPARTASPARSPPTATPPPNVDLSKMDAATRRLYAMGMVGASPAASPKPKPRAVTQTQATPVAPNSPALPTRTPQPPPGAARRGPAQPAGALPPPVRAAQPQAAQRRPAPAPVRAAPAAAALPPPPAAAPPAAVAPAADPYAADPYGSDPYGDDPFGGGGYDDETSSYYSETSSDISDSEEDTTGGLSYVELLRQEYKKLIPAAEDMREQYGQAPAPPRPDAM